MLVLFHEHNNSADKSRTLWCDCCRDDGVGLAAPQVGVNVRLMVFNPFGSAKPGNESILVNPEIVESSRLRGMDEEGCLSFPKIYGEVEVGAVLLGPCCFRCVLRAAAWKCGLVSFKGSGKLWVR